MVYFYRVVYGSSKQKSEYYTFCRGALIAAVFFTLGKQAFTWYITTFPSYQLIYGAMATLPIMLLWIQLSWTAVLLGAQLSAVLADIRSLDCGNIQIEKIKEEK